MLQYLWATLVGVFGIAAATAPLWIPLLAPLLPVAIAAYFLKPLAEKIIVVLCIVLAVWMAYKFAWQRGWDAHKADEIARNEAAISRANNAEQQMRLCEGAGGDWDAAGRRCAR